MLLSFLLSGISKKKLLEILIDIQTIFQNQIHKQFEKVNFPPLYRYVILAGVCKKCSKKLLFFYC